MIEIVSQLIQNPVHLQQLIASFKKRPVIVTDTTVASLYGEQLSEILNAPLFTFPSGEHSKTRKTKEKIENQLFKNKFGRDTCLVAFGGGVVTDIAGYVAATYCRGISLVMIPTTLIGMVDAAIGGKNGVNTPYGKNLIGSFYLPDHILIDPLFLNTLPENEMKNGIVEMIKHGLIADASYFKMLSESTLKTLSIEHAIKQSCTIKTAMIENDIKDHGKRNLLNFGHTIGHALEKTCEYKLSHGEAVAIGLLVESYLAVQLNYLPLDIFKTIHETLKKYRLPLTLPSNFNLLKMNKAMALDKKSIHQSPQFVLLSAIGVPKVFKEGYCSTIENALLQKTLQWMVYDLCRH